jgi:hypothetical protein
MNRQCVLLAVLLLGTMMDRTSAADLALSATEVTLNQNGADAIHATIVTVDTPDNYIHRRAFVWGGDETTGPKKIIAAISVKSGDRTFRVPLSAYADLGDPHQASLESIKGKSVSKKPPPS